MQATRLKFTAEEWLTRLSRRLRPLFRAARAPLAGRVRVACAPLRGRKGSPRKRFEVWPWWNSADQ
ncbi:MAG TPA: hypothetical protein VGM03_17065, partial [Phycisphaerae bacterium]